MTRLAALLLDRQRSVPTRWITYPGRGCGGRPMPAPSPLTMAAWTSNATTASPAPGVGNRFPGCVAAEAIPMRHGQPTSCPATTTRLWSIPPRGR